MDSTTLEANAAMRSIVRRDSGASYPEYLQALAEADGVEDPSRRELARRDRKRKKKTSNRDWKNPKDPDGKITKMKDGRTHLAHKAEHAVDLESGAVVAVTIQPADRGDTTSQGETLEEAARHLGDLAAEEDPARRLVKDQLMKELVADRGYHSDAVLQSCDKLGIRTYIPEPKQPRRRGEDAKQRPNDCMRIVDAPGVTMVEACLARERRKSSEVLPTVTKPMVCEGSIFEVTRTFASGS